MAMVRKLKGLSILGFILSLLMLVSCGTGGLPDATTAQGAGGAGGEGATAVSPAYIDLLVSSPQLGSDSNSSVSLTAIVKDSGNRALSGQTVTFNASSGLISGSPATTDDAGQATATLKTGGDPTNRVITVNAVSGSVTAQITVTVTGTTVEISGQDSLSLGASATYTVTLKDGAGSPIANKVVTISSLYNNLSKTTVTTDTNGQATVTLTATDTQGRSDTLTASALGAAAEKSITVNTTTFTFTEPASGSSIEVDTWTYITVYYADANGPKTGVTVKFSTSRGELESTQAITNSEGKATTRIKSSNTGTATLTASVDAGPTTQLAVEFVATTPASLVLQADPTVINVNKGTSTTEQSIITATVRDSKGNPVKGKAVNFTLTNDPSGGTLSPSRATTNSQGEASVFFIAGTSPSGQNGVEIKATVEGTALTKTVNLTVGGVALFVSLGTGNKIYSETTEVYRLDYAVLVTDAAGHPIEGATVTSKLTPLAYLKGYYTSNAEKTNFVQVFTLTSSHPNPSPYNDPVLPANYCGNENLTYFPDDRASNIYLDSGEDYNGNDSLDPGGVASATPSVVTDKNGLGTISIRYPKEYAPWVYVRLDVTVKVAGTEGRAYRSFLLPYAVGDYSYTTTWPPDSPFGKSVTCGDVN